MKKDPKIFLAHIIESVDLIEEYSRNMTQAHFLKDRVLQDAIIRRLEVIGEAVKSLPNALRAESPEIPGKQITSRCAKFVPQQFFSLLYILISNITFPNKMSFLCQQF